MRRRTMLKGVAGLTLAPWSVRSIAADAPTRADLAGDVDIMRQALALHPGLYRYNSPRQVDAALAALRSRFAAAPTQAKRYLLLSRFQSMIRCGHSYANFYNQRKSVTTDLFDRRTRLPFHFVWSGESMLVIRDPWNGLAPGTEVLAIDGRRPADLRRAMMPYVRGDGHNDAQRLSLLEARGDESIETFDVFQGLLFPPSDGRHRLRLREPSGAERALELSAIDLPERRKGRRSVEAEGDTPVWQWITRRDGIAVLTMPTWALYNSKWAWKPWLEERLDLLAGAKGLIVDLRANEGGEDCGDVILARLIERDFSPPEMVQKIRFRTTPKHLDPVLDTWDNSFRTLGVGARPLVGGFYLRPGNEEVLRVTASPKRLNVPVAVLIGQVNSSATFQFAQNIRSIGKAKLYGQLTGGNRRGINGGCYFFVRLPASGLEFDLPLVGYFPLRPQPDAGISPDVTIVPTAADIAAGRDPVMERAAADLLRA